MRLVFVLFVLSASSLTLAEPDPTMVFKNLMTNLLKQVHAVHSERLGEKSQNPSLWDMNVMQSYLHRTTPPEGATTPEHIHLLKSGLHAVHNTSAVHAALDAATAFYRDHTHHINAFVNCLFMDSTQTECPAHVLGEHVAHALVQHTHGHVHGSRPAPDLRNENIVATDMGSSDTGVLSRKGGAWSYSIRMFFWLATALYAIENVFQRHLKNLTKTLSSVGGMTDLRSKLEDSQHMEIRRRWSIIFSVFPTFEEYSRSTGNKDANSQFATEICGLSGDSVLSGELAECWANQRGLSAQAGTTQLGVNLENSATLLQASRIIPALAVLLIMSSQLLVSACADSTLSAVPGLTTECSGGSRVGSMCVARCGIDTDHAVTNFVKHSKPQILFCGATGKWFGPAGCESVSFQECYSDAHENIRYPTLLSTSSYSRLETAMDACNTNDKCGGVSRDPDFLYRLYTRTTVGLTNVPDTLFWFKGGCTDMMRRFRNIQI